MGPAMRQQRSPEAVGKSLVRAGLTFPSNQVGEDRQRILRDEEIFFLSSDLCCRRRPQTTGRTPLATLRGYGEAMCISN
jgi:hypothetical protein